MRKMKRRERKKTKRKAETDCGKSRILHVFEFGLDEYARERERERER